MRRNQQRSVATGTLAVHGDSGVTTDAIRELNESETDLAYALMAELRPRSPGAFVDQVNRQRRQGYRLVVALADREPVALAGFRIIENLASGRHLYVDDLVTRPDQRSRGYGARLLDWLDEQARAEGCGALHLDCGIQRHDAHRFYFTHGMRIGGYHFERRLIDVSKTGATEVGSR